MALLIPYASHFGRLTRRTWAYRLLSLTVLCTSLGMLVDTLFGHAGATFIAFVFVWCGVALSIQRLHDTGHSGWSLLAFIVPVVGPLWLLWRLLQKSDAKNNRYGANLDKPCDYLQVDISK